MKKLKHSDYILFYLQGTKSKKNNLLPSGKKKTKSSSKKTSKSKLALNIFSFKTEGTKSNEEEDGGRNEYKVGIPHGNTVVDTVRDALLKDLKDENFVMETPSSAICTLVIGGNLSLFYCLKVIILIVVKFIPEIILHIRFITIFLATALSLVTCIALFCRCRSLREKRRKRNLASDADGDYLVNGMYL